MYYPCIALAWLHAYATCATGVSDPSTAAFSDPIFTRKRRLRAIRPSPSLDAKPLQATAQATFFRVAKQQDLHRRRYL